MLKSKMLGTNGIDSWQVPAKWEVLPDREGNLDSHDESERKKFNSLLLESILECIEFGEVVLRFLELNSAVKRDEIAEKPEKFAMELEYLLGDGAKIIEEKIIQSVYAKIGMEYTKTEGYAFPAVSYTHLTLPTTPYV